MKSGHQLSLKVLSNFAEMKKIAQYQQLVNNTLLVRLFV